MITSLKKGDRFLWVMLFLGIFLIIVSFFWIYPLIQPQQEQSSFGSSNSFQLTLKTDAPIYNATFLIPLPVRKGIAAVGLWNLTESMFEEGDYNGSFVTWEGDQYLKITAKVVPAYEEYHMDYGDRSFRIEYTNLGYQIEYENAMDYPYWINTRHPIGNETVFLPIYNETIQEPIPESYSRGSLIYYNPVVMQYQTKIYAEFETQSTTYVHIFANIDGNNEWVEEFDAWRGNSYSDYYQKSFYGTAHGWYLADGELKSGSGKYLDGTY